MTDYGRYMGALLRSHVMIHRNKLSLGNILIGKLLNFTYARHASRHVAAH